MEALLVHCTAAFSQHGGVFAAFFLGGLAGSLTHCLAMCGPVVACQAACGGGGCGRSLGRASQWNYHLGRVFTYGALGFFAALFGKQIAATPVWPVLSSAMLVLAGALFLASSLPIRSREHLFAVSGQSNFMRGVLMGFMPCGLIYAALMLAATLADPLSGMVAMWLFVLGTMPVLLAASAGAEILSRKWQGATGAIGRMGMVFNGLSLWVIAAGGMR